ncbi:hypothetical protein ACX3T8_06605 [Corynebacterium pyruviciproducens]
MRLLTVIQVMRHDDYALLIWLIVVQIFSMPPQRQRRFTLRERRNQLHRPML